MKTIIKTALVLLFMLFNFAAFPQNKGISNYWMLGYNGGFQGGGGHLTLNFDSLPLDVHRTPRKMNFLETNASISDSRGKLLFYTNGGWIADASHDTLLNGRLPKNVNYNALFFGEQVPQECLFLEAPGDTNIYYLFYNHVENYFPPGFFASKYLYYLTIDKRLNNGLGAVVQKNQIAVNDSLIIGEITACKHANGRDWWIVCHRINSNLFYKVLFSPQGVIAAIPQYIGDTMNVPQAIGQAVFSPDGTKYVSYHAYDLENDLLILNFDRCTGNFYDPIHVDFKDSSVTGGVAFSPNSQFLYVSSRNYVYQLNMLDSNIAMSKQKIATYDGYYSPQPPFASSFFLAQLAPNGKIYINSTNSVVDLHVINYPDSLGLACDLQQHSFPLPAYNAYTMPNHTNYFLGSDSGSFCDTLQLGIMNTECKIKNEKISVYPNPAQDYLWINYSPTAEVKTLRIFDVDGKIVFEWKLSPFTQINQIDVGKFIEGIYLCRISYRDRLSSCKFIVVH
jgi:DNA-binding beta-propeller fold protein YncE